MTCLFCQDAFRDDSMSTLWIGEHFYIKADRSPANPGHLLAISRAHRLNWFALTAAEKNDLNSVIERMQTICHDERILAYYQQTLKENPDARTRHLVEWATAHWSEMVTNTTGYNLGCNCGADAGQSQLHFHYHLIPAFPGDRQYPFGGVRNCIFERGDYKRFRDQQK